MPAKLKPIRTKLPASFQAVSDAIKKSQYGDHHDAALQLAVELGAGKRTNLNKLAAQVKKKADLVFADGIAVLEKEHGFTLVGRNQKSAEAAIELMREKTPETFEKLHAYFALRHGLEHAQKNYSLAA